MQSINLTKGENNVSLTVRCRLTDITQHPEVNQVYCPGYFFSKTPEINTFITSNTFPFLDPRVPYIIYANAPATITINGNYVCESLRETTPNTWVQTFSTTSGISEFVKSDVLSNDIVYNDYYNNLFTVENNILYLHKQYLQSPIINGIQLYAKNLHLKQNVKLRVKQEYIIDPVLKTWIIHTNTMYKNPYFSIIYCEKNDYSESLDVTNLPDKIPLIILQPGEESPDLNTDDLQFYSNPPYTTFII